MGEACINERAQTLSIILVPVAKFQVLYSHMGPERNLLFLNKSGETTKNLYDLYLHLVYSLPRFPAKWFPLSFFEYIKLIPG